MKTPHRMAAAIAAGMVLAAVSAASAEDRTPLSFDEAVRRALANEEAVRIAQVSLEEARIQKSKALKSLVPDLALSTSWDYFHRKGNGGQSPDSSPTDSFGYTFSVNQPLYTGGRASSAMRSADKAISVSTYSWELTREEVYLLTAQAYLDVLSAQKFVELTHQGVNQAREFLNLVQKRFELGEVTRTSILRAELELSQRENELVQARNSLALARESLRKLVGRDFPELTEAPPAPPSPEDLESMVSRALTARKEVLISAMNTGLAEEGIVSAKGKFLPLVYANGYYAKGGGDFPPDKSEAWGVTLSIDIPIYDRGWSLSDLSLARLALDKSRLEEERVRKNIRLEVEEVHYRLQSLRASLDSLKKQVLLAEENSRGVRKQYEVGMATDLEMTTAMTDLLNARLRLAIEENAAVLTSLRLRRAMGDLRTPE